MSLADDNRIIEEVDKEHNDVSQRRWSFGLKAFWRWFSVSFVLFTFGGFLLLVILTLVLYFVLGEDGLNRFNTNLRNGRTWPYAGLIIPGWIFICVLTGFISTIRWIGRVGKAMNVYYNPAPPPPPTPKSTREEVQDELRRLRENRKTGKKD